MISIQNFYEVTYLVIPQAKTQSKILVAVLLLWIKSISKVPNLSNVYITSIEIVFYLSEASEVQIFHNG